jgi:hypothetical protein
LHILNDLGMVVSQGQYLDRCNWRCRSYGHWASKWLDSILVPLPSVYWETHKNVDTPYVRRAQLDCSSESIQVCRLFQTATMGVQYILPVDVHPIP